MSIDTTSKVKIISQALILLGEKPVSNLTDDTRDSIQSAVGIFENLYEAELQRNRWRFACAKKALDRLNAKPLNEFAYVHQLPSDALLIFRVYPRTNYEIYGDRVYSNLQEIEVDYLFKPNVEKLPAYFAKLLAYALAREMARPTSESDTTVQDFSDRYNFQLQSAMFSDAQARPNRGIEDSPFTDCR
jgi:hypothetical protein